jgi:hypothetical protein
MWRGRRELRVGARLTTTPTTKNYIEDEAPRCAVVRRTRATRGPASASPRGSQASRRRKLRGACVKRRCCDRVSSVPFPLECLALFFLGFPKWAGAESYPCSNRVFQGLSQQKRDARTDTLQRTGISAQNTQSSRCFGEPCFSHVHYGVLRSRRGESSLRRPPHRAAIP